MQCTICWYVDDTKISHSDSTVVDKVIEEIESNSKKNVSKQGGETYICGYGY